MASVVISSRSGQLGEATSQTYYCFDCDRTLTITATSDSGLICPVCSHVVLEEFETPSSSPPPASSTTFIDPRSFFPTSDTDSDVEPSEPLPPPPPPPPLPFFITGREALPPDTVDYLSHLRLHPPPPPLPVSPRSDWDFFYPFDIEARHLRPPSPPPPPPLPSVSVIGPRSPCPQFPVQSAPTSDNFFLSPPEENDTTRYSRFDSEPDALRAPLPPPPPSGHLLRSPPLSPSSSSDVWASFYPPFTESDEDNPISQANSLIRSPPSPTSPGTGDDFFPRISEPEQNSPNHQRPSLLQPPPPPPWLQPPPMEGLLDMKMTKKLVSEWECHQCSICIDNFELNQEVKLTPCNHLYHSDCLLRWLDLHKSCPVCRCKLPSR